MRECSGCDYDVIQNPLALLQLAIAEMFERNQAHRLDP